jgi:hypothetical protein
MIQSELKRKLHDLVRAYFGGADIEWGKVKSVNPMEPLITLTMGSIVRTYQPITQVVNGVPINCYPSKTTLQVDLYTKGAKTTNESGVTRAYENTAVNDLTDFLNFINSAYVDDWTGLNDISILANQVHDLTELINDTTWDYRAMAELEIGFTQTAVGYTGTMYENGTQYDEDGNPTSRPKPQFAPTPSGGRTQDLADDFTGYFEQVETPIYKEESNSG